MSLNTFCSWDVSSRFLIVGLQLQPQLPALLGSCTGQIKIFLLRCRQDWAQRQIIFYCHTAKIQGLPCGPPSTPGEECSPYHAPGSCTASHHRTPWGLAGTRCGHCVYRHREFTAICYDRDESLTGAII